MRLRTYLLMLLLIGQPVSAFNSAWQMMQPDQHGSAASSHCDTALQMASHEEGDQSAPASESHSLHENCSASCTLCAACAAAAVTESTAIKCIALLPQVSALKVSLPPGTPEVLYRPPITS